MGLFKKKYEKNVSRDNEFLKDYATKVNGLQIFVDNNQKVYDELEALKSDFQYTVASSSPEAKALEKKIKKDFEALAGALQQPEIAEAEVLIMIKGIRRSIVEISSIR